MNLVENARAFALEAHAHQRYGDDPYTIHLAEVVDVLAEFGRRDLAASGWLHDVLEDVPEAATEASLRARFGDDVAADVVAVTGVGENRKARVASLHVTLPAHPEPARAAFLKAADRVANGRRSVRAAARGAPDKLRMYRREYPPFRALLVEVGLARTPEGAAILTELDALLG